MSESDIRTLALEEVVSTREQLDRLEARMTMVIRYAHDRGCSLRAISEAADVSHEQVRRLIRADQT